MQHNTINTINTINATLYTVLFAGLGNRLFQFASAYGAARKLGAPLKVLGCNPNHAHNYNNYGYMLDNFERHGIPVDRQVTDAIIPPRDTVMIRENGEDFMKFDLNAVATTLNGGVSVIMYGFYQNEQYFKEFRDELVGLLTPPLHTMPQTVDFAHLIAIHVRLGDYRGNGKHFVNLNKYYERAIALAKETVPGASFTVVCEEPWLVYQFYPSLKDVPVIPPMEETATLNFMTKCAGVIVANSTFSWWAAYLNQVPNKFVTIPSKWINHGGVHTTVRMDSQGAHVLPVE
jgi:hypothetical protein